MGQLQLVQNPEARKWDEFTNKIDFILLGSGLGLLFIFSGLLLRCDGSGFGLFLVCYLRILICFFNWGHWVTVL